MLETNRIYLKSEPSGEIGIGKITTAELSDIMELGKNNWGRKNYLKNFASESKRFVRFKGIFNTGLDGDIGNIGTIKLVKKKALSPEYSKRDDSIYFVFFKLSKASIELDCKIQSSARFNSESLIEESVPICFPNCITDEVYGHLNCNVCIQYRYDGRLISGWEKTWVERESIEQFVLFYYSSSGAQLIARF
jgi:hypothetical protein